MAIVLARTFIIYGSLLLIMRLLGKRQLGEMELSEFVLASLIADLAAHPLQDMGIPLLNGLVPILTLFCCEVLIAGLSLKHLRLRYLLFGQPSILIRRGTIDQAQMRKNRYTLDELMQALRSQGYTDLSKIRWAILETNGSLSVLPEPAEAPVTPAQLQLNAEGGDLPLIVVSDGQVLRENLRALGLDAAWLQKQLQQRGLRDAAAVFLMTVTRDQTVYCAAREGGA